MSQPIAFDLPPFPGFREEGLTFMRELKQNNERDWFRPRKPTYEDELVWPMQCLIAQLSAEAARFNIPLTADPSKAIFRIYRDVRFSKNKNPYKTHVGAVLTKSGERKEPGGLYIHIEPGQAFITGGFWRPETRFLQAWRKRVEAQPEAFLAMTETIEREGLELESEEKLKRMPSGTQLDVDHPAAEYLKWKSFLGTRYVSDEELKEPAFASSALATMRAVLPLLEFGWELSGSKAS